MERFDGVENVSEGGLGCRRYSRGIGVVNVVIVAVKQIEKLRFNTPPVVKVIADFRIEQYR